MKPQSLFNRHRRKSIAQITPILILNKFPVGSTDGEWSCALSSGQALFLRTAQASLEFAGAFHAAPEQSRRACASHVELGDPDGKI